MHILKHVLATTTEYRAKRSSRFAHINYNSKEKSLHKTNYFSNFLHYSFSNQDNVKPKTRFQKGRPGSMENPIQVRMPTQAIAIGWYQGQIQNGE